MAFGLWRTGAEPLDQGGKARADKIAADVRVMHGYPRGMLALGNPITPRQTRGLPDLHFGELVKLTQSTTLMELGLGIGVASQFPPTA